MLLKLGVCSHAPVQGEPAQDQFIMAPSPTELCMHTELARPHDLQEALEKVIEREMVLSAASKCIPFLQLELLRHQMSPKLA